MRAGEAPPIVVMMGKRRVYLFDSLAAVAFAAMFLMIHLRDQLFGLEGGPDLDTFGLVLLTCGGLVFAIRSRWPGTYIASATALSMAYMLLRYDPGPMYLVPFLALFVLYTTVRERYWLPLTLLVGSGFVIGLVFPEPGIREFAYTVSSVAVVAGPLALGVHLYRRRVAAITERAEAAERTREQEAQRRVAEERLRIARDLHDVVAHKLATISLQAGVASHLAGSGGSGDAYDALRTIRGVSNEALTELRAVLGLLRDEESGDCGGGSGCAPLAPARDLSDLPELVAAMRAAGLRVDDDLDTGDVPVPEVVAMAAYRVVQEALTNVARHAGAGAAVRLRVARLAEALEVEVVNEAPHGVGPPSASGGRGIMGMRERVHALGGVFSAGGEADGGFRVWAVLPAAPVRPAPAP